MSFEETEAELRANVASLGFDLAGLVRRKKIMLDYVHVEPSEIHESGEYDLEGLFVRLNHAIDSIGAKRVVLDTIEALFAGLRNEAILRAGLRRLFAGSRTKAVTAVIQPNAGGEQLTAPRAGVIVSDCVILLDIGLFEPDCHAASTRGEISRRAGWPRCAGRRTALQSYPAPRAWRRWNQSRD